MADQSLSSVLCSEMGPSLGLATLLLTLTLASTIALPAHHQLAAKVKMQDVQWQWSPDCAACFRGARTTSGRGTGLTATFTTS